MRFFAFLLISFLGQMANAAVQGTVTLETVDMVDNGEIIGRISASSYAASLENHATGRTNPIFPVGTSVKIVGVPSHCVNYALVALTSDRSIELVLLGEMDFGYQFDPNRISFTYPTNPVRCILKRR